MSRIGQISLFLSTMIMVGLTTFNVHAQDQVTRYPLLELFTNTPCPICGSQDPGFFERLSGYEDEYHLVSFYPGVPYSSCIFYQANTTENTARRNYYPQIVGVPDVAINGTDFRSPNGVSTAILDDITGGTSWLSVQVSETAGIERDVTISLQDHGGGDLQTGLLFAVIVEREIMYDAPNGIQLHHNVFREFLTDVDGDEVDLSSDMATMNYQYDVNLEWQTDEVYVVAWVIDPETKEIINSGTRFDEVVASTTNISRVLPLEVFPNPTSDYLQIRIPRQTAGELRVYDSAGRLMHRENVLPEAQVRVPVANWAEGLYVAEVLLEQGVAQGRFKVSR